MPDIPAEAVARRFHEAYERLAPDFGYRTREASAKPWNEVPEQNRALMIAVCAELLPHLRAQWLAEVEGALRDNERVTMWLLHAPVNDHLTECEAAADYLRDVLGAGAGGEGE
jgi:hypothetical protein